MSGNIIAGRVDSEVGSIYRTRCGQSRTIDFYNPGEKITPYRSVSGQWFAKNGVHYVSGDDSSNDLMTKTGTLQ